MSTYDTKCAWNNTHFEVFNFLLHKREDYLTFLRQCRDKINVTANIDDKLLPTTALGIEKLVEKYNPEMEQHIIAFRAKFSPYTRIFIRINPNLPP